MAKLFELPRYIAVEGPIRVGKSTLARFLGERLAAQRVIEPEDNPFLKAFYEGEPGAAFQAQLAFLIRRFEQLRALDLGSTSNKTAVGEKAISEDYLMEVVKAYEHFFFHYTQSDLLIVNTSEIDFVDRNEDLQKLLKKVSAPIKGTQYFLPLGGEEAASA